MNNVNLKKANGHISELDSVRGLAALAVLICHLPRGFWFGETGVDLFFVLSGFLITGIILRNLDHPKFLISFYARRSLRIFPIYYLAILVVIGLNAMRQNPQAADELPFYFFYLQGVNSYFGIPRPPMELSLGHTWTLAIEEQFYLMWPFAIYFLRRKSVLWLSIIFIIVPLFLRHFGLPRELLFGHTDGLAMGGLLAYIFNKTNEKQQKNMSSYFIFFMIFGFAAYWAIWIKMSGVEGYTGKMHIKGNWNTFLISLAYFGLVGYVVAQAGSKTLKFLRAKWLMKVGTVSYGLYLYHWILYEFLDTFVIFRWKLGHPYWLDVVKIVLSFAIAFASWYLIEKPILKLKDRFKY